MTTGPGGAGGSAAAADRRYSVWRSVVHSLSARLVVLAVSAVLGIVTTRLLIEHYGPDAYAQYALLVGIGLLLPFADLGMSAAIMNVVASTDDPAHDPAVRRVVLTAVRILLCSAALLLVGIVVVSVGGWWEDLLGDGLLSGSGPLAAALCAAALALTMPFGIGQRLLTGLGRNHQSVVLFGLQSPIVVLVLVVFVTTGAPLGGYVAVIPYLAALLISAATTVVGARLITPAVGLALRDVQRVRTVRGGGFRDTAWPTMVQYVALPLALQTDKIVLSHRSTVAQLAEYSLAFQIFLPATALVATAGSALWPIFARQRAGLDRQRQSPQSIAVVFGAAGVVISGVLVLFSPLLASLASGGTIRLGLPLLLSFGLFVVAQAVRQPLGTFLTDPPGLRLQAWFVLVLLPVNLGLSWWLAGPWGAVGPILASVLTVAVIQVLPTWLEVRRRTAAG